MRVSRILCQSSFRLPGQLNQIGVAVTHVSDTVLRASVDQMFTAYKIADEKLWEQEEENGEREGVIEISSSVNLGVVTLSIKKTYD